MEFKGTKGSEDDKFFYAFNILYPNWDCQDIIDRYEQNAVRGFQVGYSQALKDSKAPEMLEMLKKASYIFKECERMDNAIYPIKKEIDQLIKEATEL